jgi:putative endopeptidase
MKKNFALLSLIALLSIALTSKINAQKSNTGLNTDFMDKTIKPSEDFYNFVNGNWLKTNEIPTDRSRWGNFDELRIATTADVMATLKDAFNNPKYQSNTDQGKAINLFKTILDTIGRNKSGIEPLKPYLKKIKSVKDLSDLQNLMMSMEPIGGIGLFKFEINVDEKNSNQNVLSLYESDLGLADRDYYVSEEKEIKEIRVKYVQHIAKMLQYLGDSKEIALSNANRILDFEILLSQPRFNRVERRDRRKLYNPMSVSELQKIVPAINWRMFLNTVGYKNTTNIIVRQPKYMIALQTILKENRVEDWKNYMRWTLLNNNTDMLSTDIETTNWDFYSKTLRGATKEISKNENAMDYLNRNIGEALGKLYIEKKFPAEAKTKAAEMVQNIIKAYLDRINKLPWMSPETKAKAQNKLNKLTIKIGYPDKWRDYSKLNIQSPETGGTFFQNNLNIIRWLNTEGIIKLTKPVDKTEWGMPPQTVNAYYNPPYNEIVFPAAFLQPPYYNYQADEALNYGGMGTVIGHEISHAFDDSGARYDADGNLVDWWTTDDLKKFTELSTLLANQYTDLEPLPGVHVDGKFTLGENIADLGGVNAAYDALQLYLVNKKIPLIDGFTPEQRFFISRAVISKSKIREEALKNNLKTDPHSPDVYRAYVPSQNIDAFYKAFDIKVGDKMYISPEKRVKIW